MYLRDLKYNGKLVDWIYISTLDDKVLMRYVYNGNEFYIVNETSLEINGTTVTDKAKLIKYLSKNNDKIYNMCTGYIKKGVFFTPATYIIGQVRDIDLEFRKSLSISIIDKCDEMGYVHSVTDMCNIFVNENADAMFNTKYCPYLIEEVPNHFAQYNVCYFKRIHNGGSSGLIKIKKTDKELYEKLLTKYRFVKRG